MKNVNNNKLKYKYFNSVESAFMLGFFLGGIAGILILHAVIKGLL